MNIETNKIEFEAEGKIELSGSDYIGEVPDEVLGKLSTELGDIEIKEFTMSVDGEADEVVFDWYVHGRRDPISL